VCEHGISTAWAVSIGIWRNGSRPVLTEFDCAALIRSSSRAILPRLEEAAWTQVKAARVAASDAMAVAVRSLARDTRLIGLDEIALPDVGGRSEVGRPVEPAHARAGSGSVQVSSYRCGQAEQPVDAKNILRS
jgi:hypothetical protein